MIRASNFLGVVQGNFKYLFFIVTDSYWIHTSSSGSLINVLEDVFARRIGCHGALVSSFTEDMEANYNLVLSKPWSPELKELLEQPIDPKLLIIATGFEAFNPNLDRFILVDFRKYRGDASGYIGVLHAIENVVTSGQDLFDWWESRAREGEPLLTRLLDATELKPGVYGFSFDLKRFFKIETYLE